MLAQYFMSFPSVLRCPEALVPGGHKLDFRKKPHPSLLTTCVMWSLLTRLYLDIQSNQFFLKSNLKNGRVSLTHFFMIGNIDLLWLTQVKHPNLKLSCNQQVTMINLLKWHYKVRFLWNSNSDDQFVSPSRGRIEATKTRCRHPAGSAYVVDTISDRHHLTGKGWIASVQYRRWHALP